MKMKLRRILRHLLMTPWQERRAFPRETLAAIQRAIETSEATHAGQLRFAVEGSLHGARLYHEQSASERAIEVFSSLRMWDTEQRNGVLIYLLLADRAVEIVADRGVHLKVGSPEWERICRRMEADFRAGRYEAGAVQGIEAVTRHLARHFPATGSRSRELPDAPVLL